jgi:hypothetical protein
VLLALNLSLQVWDGLAALVQTFLRVDKHAAWN